jgi:hypothetical protein
MAITKWELVPVSQDATYVSFPLWFAEWTVISLAIVAITISRRRSVLPFVGQNHRRDVVRRLKPNYLRR